MLTWLLRLANTVLDFFEKPNERMSESWMKEHLYSSGKGP